MKNEIETIKGFLDAQFQNLETPQIELSDLAFEEPLEGELSSLSSLNGRVLDLGCGDGSLTLNLASKNHNLTCLGVDASKNAIAFARGLAERLKIANAKFQVGSLDEIRTIPDHYFSAIVSSNFLDVIPLDETQKFLAEINRLLAPNGYLLLKVNFFIDEPMIEKNKFFVNENGEVYINDILRSNNRPTSFWVAPLPSLTLIKQESFKRLKNGPEDRLFLFQKK